MIKNKKVRIARPSTDLSKTRDFYCSALGLEELGSFENHEGFSGVMFGFKDHPYHLEFTIQNDEVVQPKPTGEDLLVFYIPDKKEWESITSKLEEKGYLTVKSTNPYWDKNGKTFIDHDNYRVVLQNSDWNF